jgi:tetratricopeptide (TPR) repeat protein
MTTPKAPRLLLTVAVCLGSLAPSAPHDARPRQTSASQALARYAAGEHDAAIASLDARMTVGALRAAAEAWVDAGDAASRPQRRRIAAAFMLDAVWSAIRGPEEVLWGLEWRANWSKPWDSPISSPRSVFAVVAWGCDAMSSTPDARSADESSGQPATADALWFLASVGALQGVRASAALLESRGTPQSRPTWDPLLVRELEIGHLAHARARVPDEPRWQMAETLARHDRVGTWQFRQRPGVLRYAPRRPETIAGLLSGFEPMTRHASLASEAQLRVAYADIWRKRWRDAIARIDGVRPQLEEPFLAAVAEYLRGWASEQLARRDEAIASYRRTLDLAPGMRNPTTLLAGQLYLADRRAEAYDLLESLYASPSDPLDLIAQFERGDARLVPAYLRRLRKALK